MLCFMGRENGPRPRLGRARVIMHSTPFIPGARDSLDVIIIYEGVTVHLAALFTLASLGSRAFNSPNRHACVLRIA